MTSQPFSRPASAGFDVSRLRAQFPLLQAAGQAERVVYLDNAATTQKPQIVIDAVSEFYRRGCANIHRGIHRLSQESTRRFEAVREQVARWINAASTREIVFVRGTTEAINLVASSFGPTRIGAGDEILITHLEHHANIVPWQLLCERVGARLKVAPIDDRGELELDQFRAAIGPRTRLAAVSQASNALGTITPLEQMIATCHAAGIPVLVDGAQAIAHATIDVRALDADFYCFSAHKLYGPSGVGVLYAREQLLEQMPPYQGGGEMILDVDFERTTFNRLPHRFEAGTPNIEGVIGFGAALDFLAGIDLQAAHRHEAELLDYASKALATIPELRLIGTARHKIGVLSFVLAGIHPHDVGTILDGAGIAVRAGHHCAQPVMARFGLPATTRASLAIYNDRSDIDALLAGIGQILEIFR